ncbi:hypothetical protein H4R35_001747 [Dimargaris xerosporica]|nr:hypothetical protein H4R35_001747 [Dimargaris xerosporica]
MTDQVDHSARVEDLLARVNQFVLPATRIDHVTLNNSTFAFSLYRAKDLAPDLKLWMIELLQSNVKT